MPAFNEEANIKKTVREWYAVLSEKSEDSRLVVADSGSTDKTHDILLAMKNSDYPKLEILDTDNCFHGPKLIALYKFAISNHADYIFQTDSDGQTNPKEFESFWSLRNVYKGGVFGNRTEREDGKDRAFVEKVVCFLLKLFFNVKVPDANAPFRLMNTKAVIKYIDKMQSDYNLPNIMLTTYFAFYKEEIIFKPISFKPRTAGKNSINIIKIVKIGLKALGDFYRFRKGMI